MISPNGLLHLHQVGCQILTWLDSVHRSGCFLKWEAVMGMTRQIYGIPYTREKTTLLNKPPSRNEGCCSIHTFMLFLDALAQEEHLRSFIEIGWKIFYAFLQFESLNLVLKIDLINRPTDIREIFLPIFLILIVQIFFLARTFFGAASDQLFSIPAKGGHWKRFRACFI